MVKTLKEVGFYSVVKGLALLVFLPLFLASYAKAATLEGWVTHVSDGDTLWVKRQAHDTGTKIRILGIDAPEICQAFGQQSRQRLADLVLGKRVQVVSDHQDKYGRALGRVMLGEQDIGLVMIAQGYAWIYHDPAGDTALYQSAQRQAKSRGLGLWSQPAMHPGKFRQHFGPCEGGKPRGPASNRW